jgi:tRNA(fMet)-specific endonuclease VapC
MNGDYLLDTNVVIAAFDRERPVLKRLKAAENVFLPSIVVGELLFGALKSSRARSNVERVEEFALANTVLACDLETARRYGQIKKELARKGRPLPENDIWIAALAQQHDLILVSRDAHFQEVDNLKLEAW